MDLPQSLQDYFQKLGFRIPPFKKANLNGVPFFIRNTYKFSRVKIGKGHCLLCFCKSETQPELTPGDIRSHFDIITKQTNDMVIFVLSVISSHYRKRLIEYGIPFIVPGTQLFIPDLALDLREYFQRSSHKKETLSPAAQASLLFVLNQKITEPMTPAGFAEKTGYSRMTMTRSVDELSALKLCEVVKTGRERNIFFTRNKSELWEKAQPFMRSPVLKEIWAIFLPKVCEPKYSGLTALSHYTMIREPKREIFAVEKTKWNRAFKEAPKNIDTEYPEEAYYKVEIWMYSPDIFSNTEYVDPLSLYLSFKNSQDERVEAALEQMIKRFQW